MNLVRTALLLVLLVAGTVGGFALPLRCFGRIPGFSRGVAFGGLVALLGSTLLGQLFAGWMETVAGTDFGVPLGMGVGCFIGTSALSCFAGGIGAFFANQPANVPPRHHS
jgi:hypothetical protein